MQTVYHSPRDPSTNSSTLLSPRRISWGPWTKEFLVVCRTGTDCKEHEMRTFIRTWFFLKNKEVCNKGIGSQAHGCLSFHSNICKRALQLSGPKVCTANSFKCIRGTGLSFSSTESGHWGPAKSASPFQIGSEVRWLIPDWPGVHQTQKRTPS